MSAVTGAVITDDSLDLRRAGRSVGGVALSRGRVVLGGNGVNRIRAAGDTRVEAWRLPCGPASAAGG